MPAVVRSLIPARPVEFLLSTNIPFLDKDNPDAYSTQFQEDFQPRSSKKAEPVRRPTPAQVDHKHMGHFEEYLTEAKVSYQRHPLPQMTRTPRWTMLCTNFKMPTDPGKVALLTTQAQNFRPQNVQVPPTPIRPTQAIKNIQRVEKLPESTSKATFTAHHGPSIVKAAVKHLEGFPTMKGEERHRCFVSQYNDTFQGAWSRAAQPVDQRSSVIMGDPVKIAERETTHTASFGRPTAAFLLHCKAPATPHVVKEHLKLNLGNFSEDSWSSTSKEDFCHHKLGSPVVTTRRNQNFSSFPKGDTDTSRNRERMSVTTNRISFSDVSPTERPVNVPGPELMTKSHVEFSPPVMSDLYYTTTAKEYYGKKDGEQARPAAQLPSNILSGPDAGLSFSTTKTDFVPLKACKQTACLLPQRNNIRFPLATQRLSTTHSEDYTAKPLIVQHPGCSQFLSHFVIK